MVLKPHRFILAALGSVVPNQYHWAKVKESARSGPSDYEERIHLLASSASHGRLCSLAPSPSLCLEFHSNSARHHITFSSIIHSLSTFLL